MRTAPMPPSITAHLDTARGEVPRALRRHAPALVIVALALLLAAVVLRTAWVSDDAFITFRTVDNALNGAGLRWNPAERVQTYTHPLWMLLLLAATAISGNPYLSSVGLSVALTAGAVALVLRNAQWRAGPSVFALVALTWSSAFVDYSTSGLENALSHALLGLLLASCSDVTKGRRQAFVRGTLVALIGTTRLDLLVLAAPLALGSLRSWRRTVPAFALGFWPLATWTMYSIVYYGVPFPNTAYAKLATGIPRPELLHQGFVYLLDSLNRDPVTLLIILTAIATQLSSSTLRSWIPGVALVLYLTYVVRIGGDFMSGRFLSAPFFVALTLLVRAAWPLSPAVQAAPIVFVLALGLSAPGPLPRLLTGRFAQPFEMIWPPSGIVDERRYYFPRTAVVTRHKIRRKPDYEEWVLATLRAQHPTTVVWNTVGMAGYVLGRGYHVIDSLALGDPLLARLPARPRWRIGHYERTLPQGYFESVLTNSNRITDPALARYYDTIREVTRGPLFTARRWKAIVRLNAQPVWAPLR
jgi:arabinofuranosyltransferase